MNLHQFRFVREAVRQNFNLTEAAKALYTSQPGVSKAIIELEDELGVEIFTRHGKREAVLLSYKDWERLSGVPSFGRLLMAAPLGEDDVPQRSPAPLRDAGL